MRSVLHVYISVKGDWAAAFTQQISIDVSECESIVHLHVVHTVWLIHFF